jgi:hypothetical protein
MDNKNLNLTCLSLSNEIRNGNINNSVKLVETLTTLKSMIKILPNNMIPLNDKWDLENFEISKIKIHDSKDEVDIDYYINNNFTTEELKQKVELKRNF